MSKWWEHRRNVELDAGEKDGPELRNMLERKLADLVKTEQQLIEEERHPKLNHHLDRCKRATEWQAFGRELTRGIQEQWTKRSGLSNGASLTVGSAWERIMAEGTVLHGKE
jgi:hypothetical protein